MSASRTSRSTKRHGTIWTAFVILMMLASMFSTLVDPAFAQDGSTEDTSEQTTEQVTGSVDTDGDGLTDEEEAQYGTDPNLADTDGDDLSDYDEVMLYGTDPSDADMDDDGLSDFNEIMTFGTDPFQADSDGDTLPDGDEVNIHGTNPNAADSDGDGVNDDVEFANGTDPTVADAQTETETDEQFGNVRAYIWECPYDYNPANSGDRDTMRAECNLYDGDPVASWRVSPYLNAPIDAAVSGGNMVEFLDVPIGNTGLAMLTPQVPVKVYCEGNIIGGGSNTKPYAAFSNTNNSVAFDLLANEQVDCDWFINAPQTVDIIHTKYICDWGYDTANKPLEQLRTDCNEPVIGYAFVVQSGAYNENRGTDEMANNSAAFMDVPAGMITMYEISAMGDQFLAMYCYAGDEENPAASSYSPASLDQNGQYSAQYDGGYVRCDWFNRAPQYDYDTNYLIVYKHMCEIGVQDGAPANGSAEDSKAYYDGECEPESGWTLTLQKPDGSTDPKLTDQDGKAIWEGLPTGTWTLTETLPQGYEDPFVYCRYTDWPDDVVNGEWAYFDAPGGAYSNGYGYEGMGMECHLYNLAPADGMDYDPNYLILYKHECDLTITSPNTGSDEDDKAYFDGECPTVEGWDFDVEYPDGSKELKRTDADGKAVWEGMPTGTWTMTEMLPEDYEEPFVYCRYTEWPDDVVNGEWAQFRAPGGSYSNGFAYDGMGMECHLYNLAPGIGTQGNLDEPSDLRINKRICPPGYDPTAQGAVPMTDCPMTAPDGIEFTISDEDPNTEDTTSSTGDQAPGNSYVQFGGLAPGMHTITETQDPAYANAYLWVCENYQNAVAMPISEGWTYQMDVPAGLDIACEWLNIPAVEDDLADLYVYKYMCPVGYDYAAANADPMVDCDPGPNGITFTLSDDDPNTADQQSNTGDSTDYQVMFGGLEPGNYTLTEALYPSIDSNFLWICEGYQNGAVSPWSTSGSYDLILSGGDMITCHWFNIPVDEDAFSVTLYKWRCPYGTMQDQTDPAYYDGECATEHAGVPFTLTHGGPQVDFESDTMGEQIDNVIPDASGQFTITEDIQPGWLEPVGYCQPLNEDGGQTMLLTGGALTVTVPDNFDDDYHCWFYNFPEDDLADLYIDKYTCPVAYDYTAPGADPMVDCMPGPNGVNFTLTDADPATPDLQTMTGDAVDYRVMFGGLEPGDYTVTETMLPEFESSFLWSCDGYENGAMPPSPWSTTGSYDFSLTGGSTVHCYWFNIPMDDDFSVTVYKWECPAGTEYGNPDPNYYSGECATELPGVPFTITDGNGSTPFMSDNMGHQIDGVVPTGMGQFILAETIPDGYGDPVGYCQPVNGPDGTPMTLVNGILTVTVPANFDDDYHCWYYNIPEDPGMVTIYKWDCPEGMEIEKTLDAHKMNCVTPLDTIEFTLEDSMGPRTGTTAGGVVEWNDVMIETITVAESIPLGYNPQPYVSCRFAEENAMVLAYSVYNGVLTATLNHAGQHIICDWFNQYEGPGEVTVYKWECPEGYDRNAWNADPATDCQMAYNGVTFVLDQPEGPDLQSNTGDSVNGAVYFGGLMPGQYTLSEMVPEGIVDVFVLDCVGMDVAYVHPVPLSVGPNLSITVGAGDSIRCDWYNVPGYDPDYGWLTLTKYICSTPKYVSDIDCLLYAGGQQFDLQAWNGSTWTTVQSGTTDATGKLTFMNLDPGTYRLTEPGKTACMIKADRISSDDNLSVVADGGTTVKVYNCGTTPTTPKTPTKYPNTGVGPTGDDLRTMDGLSLLGLLGTGAVISRRRLVGAAAVSAGTIALGRSIAAQPVIPLDAPATPDASPAPAADCMFPATPAATPEGVGVGTPVACARGAVPVQIRIPVIEVDAPIEYLEFIEGQMEQPTGETDVAWYKNSARLGEQGNGIYAGHLNWWNVPEAVFFRLGQLQEGDVIEIEGDDGEIFRYIVQWSEDFPSDEEPPDEAVGHTEEQAITLITCGGEWNAGRAEYDHRTLVRAVRDIEAFAESGG